MRFGRAELLLLLWLVPATGVFFAWAFRRKRQLLLRFAAAEVLGRLLPAQSPGRQRAKAALLVIAIGALALALAEPRWGWRWEEMHRKGADVLVAIDVSKSMLAEDLKPSRLERAKREVIDLLRVVDGDRIGLLAFAGAAFVQCPLTLDYGAAQIFLDSLSPELIPVPGTALAEAIRTATAAFGPGAHDARALVLITDGEDLEDGAIEAAKEAKKEGIKIFAVGMGAPDGAPIPDPAGGFRKDEQGNVVLSRLDETTLQKIALETGGTYVRAGAGGLDLEQLYWKDIKGRTSARELESPRQRRWEERFQWFVGLALLALVVEALFSERRPRGRGGKGAAFLCLFALLCGVGSAHAESTAKKVARASARVSEGKLDEALKVLLDAQVDDPANPVIQYNVGIVQERLGHHDEAKKALEAVVAGPDAGLRARAAYNLGNVAFAEGKLDEAIERFKRALEFDPNDADAKHNLEVVRDELKRRIEEAKKRQEEQKKQQDQQKQDQQKQDQQKQDQQKQDQQKQDQQKQDQQKQDQQKQDQQKQQQQGKAGKDKDKPQEPRPEPDQPGGGKDDKKDETQKQDPQQGQAQAARAGRMSKEDAERLLRSVREDPTKFQKRRVRAAGGARGGRDW